MRSAIKSLLFPVAFVLSANASGQINLEHTYPVQSGFMSAAPANLTNFGKKLVTSDTSSNVVKLFNTDHTLFKSITVPTLAGYKFVNAIHVSDNLFNSDNLVEMMGVYYSSTLFPKYRSLIFNETGNTIKDLDSASFAAVYKDDNDNYKLKAYGYSISGNTFYNYFIYSLPGSLPCDNCNALKTGSVQRTAPFVSGPIPNPSEGNTVINYMLPQGVDDGMLTFYNISGQIVGSYPVYSSQNSFRLDAKFPAGNYVYHLQTQSGISETQKLTVK